MHKLIPAALAVLTAFAAPASAATRTYIVTDFDNLRLEAPIEVVVTSGRGVSARGEGDANTLSRIDLAVSARTLTIRLKPSPYEARRDRNDGPAKLFVSVPVLRHLQLAGAGSLKVSGGLDKLQAEILASGSGSVAVSDIATDRLGVVQTGSGAIAITGKAKRLDIHVAGSGALAAGALASSDLGVLLEGSATIEAAADRSVKILATGPGSVTVAGKAACTVSRAGSGSVLCGGKSY
jgi:hypothetical protein